MSGIRLMGVVFAAVGLLAMEHQSAWAQGPLEGLPAVKRKVLLHEGRHLLTPSIGSTLNDPYVRNVMLGASWRYFPQSWLGLGADIAGGGAVRTGLTEHIETELTKPDVPYVLETSSLAFLLHASAEIVPLEGKVMLLGDRLWRFSLFVHMGFGMAYVKGSESGRIEDRVSLMPTVGGGIRLYPSNWVAFGLEARDCLVERVLSSRSDGSIPGHEFSHNVLTTLSVSFFIPEVPGVQP